MWAIVRVMHQREQCKKQNAPLSVELYLLCSCQTSSIRNVGSYTGKRNKSIHLQVLLIYRI